MTFAWTYRNSEPTLIPVALGLARGDIIGGELYECPRLTAEARLVGPGCRPVHRVPPADPEVGGQEALGGGRGWSCRPRAAARPRARHHHRDVTKGSPPVRGRVEVI